MSQPSNTQGKTTQLCSLWDSISKFIKERYSLQESKWKRDWLPSPCQRTELSRELLAEEAACWTGKPLLQLATPEPYGPWHSGKYRYPFPCLSTWVWLPHPSPKKVHLIGRTQLHQNPNCKGVWEIMFYIFQSLHTSRWHADPSYLPQWRLLILRKSSNLWVRETMISKDRRLWKITSDSCGE